MTQRINPSRKCEAEWIDSETLDCNSCEFGPVLRTTIPSLGDLLVSECVNAYESKHPSDTRKKSFESSLERYPDKLITFYFLAHHPYSFTLEDFNEYAEVFNLGKAPRDALAQVRQQGILRIVHPDTITKQAIFQRSSEVDWDYIAGLTPVVQFDDAITDTPPEAIQMIDDTVEWLRSLHE